MAFTTRGNPMTLLVVSRNEKMLVFSIDQRKYGVSGY